jgi:hypothetical protein
LIFWGFAAVSHPVISSVLFSATRKNYTQVLVVVQIGGVVIAGERHHIIPTPLFLPEKIGPAAYGNYDLRDK